jgi:precorrin-6x reductase
MSLLEQRTSKSIKPKHVIEVAQIPNAPRAVKQQNMVMNTTGFGTMYQSAGEGQQQFIRQRSTPTVKKQNKKLHLQDSPRKSNPIYKISWVLTR